MTTIRVDNEDFRQFISWLISNAIIQDSWDSIASVHENPGEWMDEYLRFQKETYEPEIRSYKCKTCGAIVTENDVKDYETAEQFGECGPCYAHPGNWGNE